MRLNVCFIYPWATFGGVERILINRALAFRRFLFGIKVDFLFLKDAGGLEKFSDALKYYKLEEFTAIVSSLEKDYDMVFIIDCPQAINLCNRRSQRFVVECHTDYKENRKYLAALPSECEGIITPSHLFSKLIKNEVTGLEIPIFELSNFVPWDIQPLEPSKTIQLPKWDRIPILFFGRMDILKDPLALLDAFILIKNKQKGKYILILCGPTSIEIDIQKEISKRSLNSSTVVLPPIPFISAPYLFEIISRLGGLFVSPSKGESFGLSAAEAIASNVPAVLSDIDAHTSLVENSNMEFTYKIGDSSALSDLILTVFENYELAYEATNVARESFSAKSFIQDWQNLFQKLEEI